MQAGWTTRTVGWWFLAGAVAALAACLDWHFTAVTSAESSAGKQAGAVPASPEDESVVEIQILEEALPRD